MYVDSVQCFIVFHVKRGIGHSLVVLWTNDYDDQIVFLCIKKNTKLDNCTDRKEQLLNIIIKKFVHSVTAKTRQAGFAVLITTDSFLS